MITAKIIGNGILRALAIGIGLTLLLFFIYKIQSIILFFFIALFVSMLGNPLVIFLKKRLKFKHIIAVIVTLFFFLLLLAGFLMMFVPLIISQGENISLLDTATLQDDIVDLMNQLNSYFSSHNIDAEKLLKESNLASKLNLNFIPAVLNSFFTILGDVSIAIGSILFITFFFLKDRELIAKTIKTALPEDHKTKILRSYAKINSLLSRYFLGLLAQLSILFVLYLVILLIFGVENALIIAFITALFNIIPYIGPLIASILAGLLTLLSLMGPATQSEMIATTLYVLIGYSLTQVIDNNLTSPFIFSKSVNSHPLEIFVVILISGFVSGIVGMIIAVPFYTSLKVIFKEIFPENKIIQIITKNI
jgi:predicted PurR-regulated permease PerM